MKWIVAGIAILAAAGAAVLLRPARKVDTAVVYRVAPMEMAINVLEGGTLAPANSLEIKNLVEGSTKIISVIPEGTQVTQEDVDKGRVLMELDSSSLRAGALQQEVTLQSAEASLTQARESYLIQTNQNDSNIKAAELKMQFARMDVERYLGSDLGNRALEKGVGFPQLCASAKDVEDIGAQLKALGLAGAGSQQWSKLQSDIDLAGEEVSRAETSYEWSKRLGPPEMGGAGYITRSDVDADALALKRRKLDQEQAALALQIFLRYEFPKQAEQLLADYTESTKELERQQARARAELAKADADVKSRDASFRLQSDQLDKLRQQTAACIIRAQRPGMVVYPPPGRGGEAVEEGAVVRERQTLLTIPDSKEMLADVKVHEGAISKVKVGQSVRIIPEGFRDTVIHGQVTKLAPMADRPPWWMSQDLKVYSVSVALQDPPRNLKPGMTVQAEIQVSRLPNVLAIPLQSVRAVNGSRVCYVRNGGVFEPRKIETGEFNDSFIEIRSGLTSGEYVRLTPPPLTADDTATPTEDALAIGPSTEPPGPVAGQAGPPAPATPTTTIRPAEGTDPIPAPAADLEALLGRIPEDRRADMKARVEAMSAEDRTAWIKRMQDGGSGGNGGGRRPRQPRTDQPQ